MKANAQNSNAVDGGAEGGGAGAGTGVVRTRGKVIVNGGTLHKFWQQAVTVMIAKVNDNDNNQQQQQKQADVRPGHAPLTPPPRRTGSKALAGNRSRNSSISPKVNTEEFLHRGQKL